MKIRLESGKPLQGALIYEEAEYSFRFESSDLDDLRCRIGNAGVASLSVGTLQIEMSVTTGQLLFAWGLHPKANWIESNLGSPSRRHGALFFEPAAELGEGISVSLVPVGSWCTWLDTESGWVRVSYDSTPDQEQTEIAQGVVVGQRHSQLSSIWLLPDMQ